MNTEYISKFTDMTYPVHHDAKYTLNLHTIHCYVSTHYNSHANADCAERKQYKNLTKFLLCKNLACETNNRDGTYWWEMLGYVCGTKFVPFCHESAFVPYPAFIALVALFPSTRP